MRCLMLTLYAPLAANGRSGAARQRLSWTRPSRSAVLGMVAAALGIDREDDETHAALSDGFGYAVRTDATGGSLIDYHIARPGRGRDVRTRREELQHTSSAVISHREYRTDALYTVALWAREGCRWSLEGIAEALRRPRWVLYLGRKSCPLGLPLDPQIVEAETLQEAFRMRPALHPEIADSMPIRLDNNPQIATDADGIAGLNARQIETRRDLYYGRRLFRDRAEHIMEA